MTSREKILNNIRTAIKVPSHVAGDPKGVDGIIRDKINHLVPPSPDGLVEQFKTELALVSGEFYQAASDKEAVTFIEKVLADNNETQISYAGAGLIKRIIAQLDEHIAAINPRDVHDHKIETVAAINTSVVEADYAIADTGTLVIPFGTTSSTLPHFLPDTVIALVQKTRIMAHQIELFERLDVEQARNMLMVTGPSRTADIEKILILGAHGPRRLIVVLLANE